MNTKNRKKTTAPLIIIILTVSLLYLSNDAIATPTISITIDTHPTKVGDTFIANINVAGVEYLWGWEATITWNTDVLKATRSIKGPFLISGGATDLHAPPAINNIDGTIYLAQALLEESNVSGTGVLEQITFEVIGTGNADIAFSDKVSLTALAGSPVSGKMPFTYGDIPKITISNTPPQESVVIKVSTDKTSYSSDDLVSVSAKVTFNGGAVASNLVTFSIYKPDGALFSTDVETTDSSGTATYTFRLPTPATPDEWSVLVASNIAEVATTDTAKFSVVGSSLAISSISIGNLTQTGKVSINITLTGTILEGLILTANIFDSAQIPLGLSTVSIKPQTEDNTTITTEIIIPSSSFNGQATVYVNILTATPDKAGVLYCPQSTMTFQIP